MRSSDLLTFSVGMSYLQRFGSIYDTTNARLGLAKTKYTMATSNYDGGN